MRVDYHIFRKNQIMNKYTSKLTLIVVLSLILTSCVERKTKDPEGTIRLEAPTDNSADTDYTESLQEGEGEHEGEMSNEETVELAEAKTTINDYYDAFTRSAPREAFDMWEPDAQEMQFSDFAQENADAEDIVVTFDENAEVQPDVNISENETTVHLPIRVSKTTGNGTTITHSGTATLKKDTSEDNAQYVITSLDTTQEDS